MFGKLRIARCRLDDAANELYRGHFCGSCHAMHEFSGRLSSLLTNYDQTVLGMVLGILEGRDAITLRPCTAVPFRRVPIVELSPDSRRYLAAVNLALVEAKLIDDVQDDGGFTRRAGLRLLRGKNRRATAALSSLGFPVEVIHFLPTRQGAVERSEHATLEELSAPSAQLTGTLFAFAARVTERPEHADCLRRFGAALGRYVYVLDAFEDRIDDRRHRRFNAIDHCLGTGGHQSEIADHLRRPLGILDASVGGLPAGGQREILRHLLATMGTRVEQRIANRSREAGECDAICAICEVGECCGGSCSCCDCSWCWWTNHDATRKKKAARAARRESRAKATTPPSEP